MSLPPGATLVSGSIPDASQLPPGATLVSGSLPTEDTSAKEGTGFWAHVGKSLRSMAPEEIPSFTDALKQAGISSLGPGYQALQALHGAAKEYAAARERGHGVPYSAAAGLSTTVGVSPERVEQAAEQGDTAGVLGEAAIPTAMAVTPLGAEGAGKVLKATGASDAIGTALRTPEGKLKPSVKTAASATGAIGGHFLGIPGAGELGGLYLGPKLADMLIPSIEPSVAKAVPIRQSPNFDPIAYNAGRKGVSAQELAAQQATKEGTGITVVPEPRGQFSGEIPNYMASVPRGTLEDLAIAAKPGAGTQLQQLGRPIIYEPRGAGISNVKSSVSLSEMAPVKPDYAYRVRDIGEEGVPANATERRAHATTSLEDAKGIMQDRGSVTGKEQEMVKYDLSKLKEGVDYLRHPREGQPDWIQMLRPVPESAVRRVRVQ